MSTHLDRIVDNLLNGNLTDAKRQAKRASYFGLFEHLYRHLGWSHAKAKAAVLYLKRPANATFQAYCDAV